MQKNVYEEKKNRGPIKSEPYKILEAPYLRDDFYLNLVDWSDNDNIGVGLQTSLFVWSGCTSKVRKVY
jgi:cell division cycle 20-like protein 1 (cofactor of APC complex)